MRIPEPRRQALRHAKDVEATSRTGMVHAGYGGDADDDCQVWRKGCASEGYARERGAGGIFMASWDGAE